ncbi:MAG: ADP-forming succinate--CoA ligase subunit beta [Gammaproteobacteria bacterium]|nr:ADP-forming succinate--CoA ligase subunit beta [Gammaproteobacteria bacterium]
MNLHEYQAKALFARHQIPVPEGRVAANAEEAESAARALGGEIHVVKAQVHAGGRGKAGGVKLVHSPAEAGEAAASMIGRKLVTHQTGGEGLPIERVWVERGSKIARELYLSLLVDRAHERLAFIASPAGGMDIEAVARETPEKITTVGVNPGSGLSGFEARRLGFALGLEPGQMKSFAKLVRGLYDLTLAEDASLVEINPLIVTDTGDILALDAKLNLDDNALYRHKELAEMRDPGQEDPAEAEAGEHGLNYVSLDGNIACMVNGAGLAMATMDLIQLSGGTPANFLDVGGGATAERVTAAFRLILSNENVSAILINIFGGIVRCDVIAEGIIAAVKGVGVPVPVVVRLEGTNAEAGRELLDESGLDIIAAEGLAQAAEKAVEAAGETK